MTTLLHEAFEAASSLPEQEQDALAKRVLAAVESEQRWQELFDDPRSDMLLEQLGDEALKEHRRGKTRTLDAETL